MGINCLTKIQMPTIHSLYGAMLAGCDYVIMGAGIPMEARHATAPRRPPAPLPPPRPRPPRSAPSPRPPPAPPALTAAAARPRRGL